MISLSLTFPYAVIQIEMHGVCITDRNLIPRWSIIQIIQKTVGIAHDSGSSWLATSICQADWAYPILTSDVHWLTLHPYLTPEES